MSVAKDLITDLVFEIDAYESQIVSNKQEIGNLKVMVTNHELTIANKDLEIDALNKKISELEEPAPPPAPLPIVVSQNPKVYDKGLTSDKVTSDYGQRLIVDTKAKYDALMKDSGGWLRFQNHGGLWIKNIPLVNIPRLDSNNCWVMLFENCTKVIIGEYDGLKGKTGLEIKNNTFLKIGNGKSFDNFRLEDSRHQGDGIIINSADCRFEAGVFETGLNGDSGIDNKGYAVIEEWISTLDGGGLKSRYYTEIKKFTIKDAGRNPGRNQFGYGIQSRADGAQDSLVVLHSGLIDNCEDPDQSIKASVVNTGKKSVVEIRGAVTVKRPAGYTGSVFMEVNGGDIPQSSRDKVTVV